MRMRKKPWARPELEECEFFIQKPSEYKGRWKEFFKNDNPIYMELGCGKGTLWQYMVHKIQILII